MSVVKAAALPHDSAHRHVTGEALYVDDIALPSGTLHLAFGLSGIACGQIKSIDLSSVRAAEGVRLVICADDLAYENDVSPATHDEPLLSEGSIHYLGQPIFLVAADTHILARKAARQAKITYEEARPILSIEDALEAESYFEQGPIVWQSEHMQADDIKAVLSGAEKRLSGQIEIGGQEHFYLEGQVAAALAQEGDGMLVYSSSQHPTEIQHKVAAVLGIDMNAVRVEVRRMGGGFGGKESQGNALAVAAALVAKATGRAAKIRYDRDDDMIITGKRHDFRICYDVGYDETGRVWAVDFTQYVRCGWGQDLSLAVCDRAMLHADNAYHIPALRIASHRLRTNMQSATAFRGFGGPQGIVGIERVMDEVAFALGEDPALVRARNFYPEGDAPAKTHYAMVVEKCPIDALVLRLKESADYEKRRAAIKSWNGANPTFKRGLALTPVKFGISFTLLHLNQAGALIHIYQDGSIHLNHGGTEMGQGLFQKVAQVAASVFGVSLGRIRITATDTGKVPNTSPTAASSGSDINAMAVKAACEVLCARLRAHLVEAYNAPLDGIVFADDRVHFGGESRSFSEAIQSAYLARVSLSSTGFYKTPKLNWDRDKGQGRPFLYFAYGASISEVVVDGLTGEMRTLRVDILHDTGNPLNPAIDIGQIEGGFVQGAGWLTMEELVWDQKGALKTHAPSTYKIPAFSDRPAQFNVALWDQPNFEKTIYRSKAVGEPPLMLGISTFMALSDALSAFGDGTLYPDLNAPATPERLLWAIQRQQGL